MLYIQYYIKSVHFWLKYNGLAIVRKTTKLIEGGHRGVQDICYYFYVFNVFKVFLRFFFKIQKVVTFSRDFLRFFAVFRTFPRTMNG